MSPGSLLSVLRPLLTPAPARRSLLTAAPAVAGGLGLQVSLSKNVNSCCTTGPFIFRRRPGYGGTRPELNSGLRCVVPARPLRQPYMVLDSLAPARSALRAFGSAKFLSRLPSALKSVRRLISFDLWLPSHPPPPRFRRDGRNLAIPQLPRSSACVILPLAMRGSLTVFPHRGLSPHQFTPMSGAHQITGANAGGSPRLPNRTRWAARIAQFCRWAAPYKKAHGNLGHA